MGALPLCAQALADKLILKEVDHPASTLNLCTLQGKEPCSQWLTSMANPHSHARMQDHFQGRGQAVVSFNHVS